MKRFQNATWFVMAVAVTAWTQQFSEITGWKMQDSTVVGSATGETISASSYDASSWHTATVPGTVLNTYVDCKVYKDPNYDLNMVDIPDLAKQQHRYWFRTTFNVAFSAGQRVWLELGGINYFATIYLNGKQVGTMFGAFKEGIFDVTDKAVSGANCLVVKIRGNYTPGEYHHKESGPCGPNGGPMTQDGPTFIATQGWDWIPTVPDRCMGIWKPVYVRVTGPVAIRHPWIKTTNVSATSATVPLQVMLRNATGSPVAGTLNAAIDGGTQFTAQTVTVPANDTLNVNFPALTMSNPKLWWPNGYGDPNLYTCTISFTPTGGTSPSDTVTFKFGVRQYAFSTSGGSLVIYCNGKRLLPRGGNWGMDDAMKRWDLHKTRNKVRYHKEMNFNIIRDWIGQTDNEPFYSYCDEYGIMVWADFWEPHSADGPTPAVDKANYIANMQDKIYRVRNHASVVLWCERNETTPSPEFLSALQSFHTNLDGTRYVQGSSGSGGVHSGGPYTYTSPKNAYSALTGFHTELGGPTVMSYESMLATFSDAYQMPMGNKSWYFHDYCIGNGVPENYTNAMKDLFGVPATLKDCGLRGQLMNYDDYRAYFEALQAKRFNGATGLLLWMSNCVWPSQMWQTYDYYMEGTGAMFGSQKGSEPIHVMYYGFGSYQVSVVNSTHNALDNYSVAAATYNLNGAKAWSDVKTVSVGADASLNVCPITAGSSTPYFLDLKLKDASGKVVSKNFYWLPNSNAKISAMLTMNKTTLIQIPDAAEWTKSGEENTLSLKLVNTGTVCAVACRLQLTGTTSGVRVLPVHYNDNYFSLIPGDTQTVVVKYDEVDCKKDKPNLTISGVNVDQTVLKIGGVDIARWSAGADHGNIKMYTSFTGNVLRLRNVPEASVWSAKIFDMLGHTVLEASGNSQAVATIPTNRLVAGAYIATVTAGAKRIRTVFVVH